MYLTAFQVGTQNHKYVTTTEGQQTYQIDNLVPGTYHLVAYTAGDQSFPAGLSGGYTQAVPCGLSENCSDHSLLDISVAGGQAVTGINPADWYLIDDTFPPFPDQALIQATVPTAVVVATGAIAGTLQYPSSSIPALRAVAFQVGSIAYYYVDTEVGQSNYSIHGIPPGVYHVVAYVRSGGGFSPGPAGGYSHMVPCGLKFGCNDHSLLDVNVTAGSTTTGVDPNDYYADPGTFPPNPAP